MALMTLSLVACKVDVQPLESTDKIVIIGDDLTFGSAGRGVTFPAELGTKIGRWVVNEGKEGETSTSAKVRLSEVLEKNNPSHLMIAIGSIDMQQKVSDEVIEDNIKEMIQLAKEKNIVPIVIGATRPVAPGSGLKLTDAAFYKSLSSKEDVVYIDNVFSDVLDQPKYKASPTLLADIGYKEVADLTAKKMLSLGFIKELKNMN